MATRIRSDDAQLLELPGRISREIVSGRNGAQSSTLRIVEIDPGPTTRGPHLHDGFEEVIYVLAGQGILKTDSGNFDLQPGDTALVPPNERHQTVNTGKGVLLLHCSFPVADIRPGTREFESWDDG